MTTLKLTFIRERETKGTWRYQEQERPEGEAVGSLYVKKAVFGAAAPERLRVTIEAE